MGVGLVAPDDGFYSRVVEFRRKFPIDLNDLYERTGLLIYGFESTFHGKERGVVDINSVDLFRPHPADTIAAGGKNLLQGDVSFGR